LKFGGGDSGCDQGHSPRPVSRCLFVTRYGRMFVELVGEFVGGDVRRFFQPRRLRNGSISRSAPLQANPRA